MIVKDDCDHDCRCLRFIICCDFVCIALIKG
jgi:hypothetical protein